MNTKTATIIGAVVLVVVMGIVSIQVKHPLPFIIGTAMAVVMSVIAATQQKRP